MMTQKIASASGLPAALIVLTCALAAQDSTSQRVTPTFLKPCLGRGLGDGAVCGKYEVFEDRATRKGRKIALNVVVLRATGPNPRPDPVFFIAGGPGGSATRSARGLSRSWMRRDRDIVLIDQRGAGNSNPLHVQLPGDDSNLQGFLDPIWNTAVFERARKKLEKIADLTKYTTCIAADDLNELRIALGYDMINLVGGSYGTRASLVYIRRHPKTVRTAILTGVAPIAFKNPLYHAKAAQEGFDALVAECNADARYKVYHDLDKKLATILDRLRKTPASVTVQHPRSGNEAEVKLTANAFAEALRVMMYYMGGNRRVPLMLHRAHAGDYRPFAQLGLQGNYGLRGQLAFGMLMSVVGTEDIPRIDETEIVKQTAGTFLGDARVRGQSAVAKIWPRGEVPANYGDPVRGDMPVLFISGTHDPVTPPRWGADAARHFPNGLHLVVPAAHGTNDPEIEKFKRRFLNKASLEGLDTSFVEKLKLPRLPLPKRNGR